MSERLLAYVLWAENEADRLEASIASISNPEARKYAMARYELVRGVVKTLDLVLAHEPQFVAMVRAASEAKTRAARIKGANTNEVAGHDTVRGAG